MIHLETTTLKTSATVLTTTKCKVCGESHTISDFADGAAVKAHNKIIEKRHQVCGLKYRTERLDNARKALESEHVEKVQASFEYEADGVRYYSAITNDSGFQHLYTVRVWENADGWTIARCGCKAINECRHIGKVAKVDAQRCGRNVYYGSFENYSAHKQPMKAA